MENMPDKELCLFIKQAVNTLYDQKKEEVMKCVGQFVLNDKIVELNKQISNFQKQCKHLDLDTQGRCVYCREQIHKIK